MKKLVIFLFAVILISCEKEEAELSAKLSIEKALGIVASKSPLGGEALFFQNIRYGNETRNVLDILVPNEGESKGVVLFFHGGGFVAGDKEDAYDDLLRATLNSLIENKITIVSANYTFINTPGSNELFLLWKMGQQQ